MLACCHRLFFGFVVVKKAKRTSCHCLLFWFCCNEKGDDSLLRLFIFGFVAMKKAIVACYAFLFLVLL